MSPPSSTSVVSLLSSPSPDERVWIPGPDYAVTVPALGVNRPVLVPRGLNPDHTAWRSSDRGIITLPARGCPAGSGQGWRI